MGNIHTVGPNQALIISGKSLTLCQYHEIFLDGDLENVNPWRKIAEVVVAVLHIMITIQHH